MLVEGTPNTPFERLVGMEKMIRAQQTRLPQISSPEDWLGLAFLSGNQVLLTPLDEMLIILPVTTFAYIPGVRNWLLGLATYRDDIFPVTDLAGFIGQKLSSFTKHTRLLVIDSQGEKSGLLVDRVIGLQRVSQEQRKNKKQAALGTLYGPYLMGCWENNNMTLPIISCKAIINHPRFRDVLAKAEVINAPH